jgi:putative endonuclease
MEGVRSSSLLRSTLRLVPIYRDSLSVNTKNCKQLNTCLIADEAKYPERNSTESNEVEGPISVKQIIFMDWYVYIAKAKTKRYYTGISNDVEERIKKHNSGTGSRMAKQQGPFELVYKSKPFLDKSSARIREAQIKGWCRKKKEKIINKEWK